MSVSTLSFSEKIKILPWKSALATLGAVDSLGAIPEKVAAGSVKVAILLFFMSFFFPHTPTSYFLKDAKKVPEYLPTGLVYTFYKLPVFEGADYNVLGASAGILKHNFPLKEKDIPYPVISAKSALIVDKEKNKVLFDLNGSERLAPASTTKLMTALVARDLYENDEEIAIPSLCTTIESTRAGWKETDVPTVDDLLHTLLIGSAGDSACALATHKVSHKDFIDLMNTKAISLGMVNTVFSNPVGLDGAEGTHYSTASDLYVLSREVMEDPALRSLVSETEYSFGASKIYNTNRLLWEIPGTIGVKTGTTTAAGEVLIYEFMDGEKDLVIVVMGSKDRFTDTRALLNWALDSFTWN